MKPKTQPVARPETSRTPERDDNHAPEPLSGSADVKRRNQQHRPNNSDR